MSILLRIADRFTTRPGARYVTDGPHSGEEFRKKLLENEFRAAMEANEELIVDLDGTAGYATSFLEEAFGGLARLFGIEVVHRLIRIKSDEEPDLREEVDEYIREAKNKPRR